jgi:hypothetical protein
VQAHACTGLKKKNKNYQKTIHAWSRALSRVWPGGRSPGRGGAWRALSPAPLQVRPGCTGSYSWGLQKTGTTFNYLLLLLLFRFCGSLGLSTKTLDPRVTGQYEGGHIFRMHCESLPRKKSAAFPSNPFPLLKPCSRDFTPPPRPGTNRKPSPPEVTVKNRKCLSSEERGFREANECRKVTGKPSEGTFLPAAQGKPCGSGRRTRPRNGL